MAKKTTKPKARKKIESKDVYVLIIDKERQTLLTAMLNTVHSMDGGVFYNFIAKEGLEESFRDLATETAKKEHERGWCNDPTCTYEKRKKDK